MKSKEERKLYLKKYYKQHRKELEAYRKKYFKQHREKYCELQRAYRKRNFKKFQANGKKYRSRPEVKKRHRIYVFNYAKRHFKKLTAYGKRYRKRPEVQEKIRIKTRNFYYKAKTSAEKEKVKWIYQQRKEVRKIKLAVKEMRISEQEALRLLHLLALNKPSK